MTAINYGVVSQCQCQDQATACWSLGAGLTRPPYMDATERYTVTQTAETSEQ